MKSRLEDPRAAMERFDVILNSAVVSVSKEVSSRRSVSPIKLSFLTKDSNNTAFTGIDVDERLNEVDAEWKVMKEAFNISIQDKKAMETAVQMAKSQGAWQRVN